MSKLRNVNYSTGTILLFTLGQLPVIWLCALGSTIWAYDLLDAVYWPNPSIHSQVLLATKLSISTALLSLFVGIVPIMHAQRMSYKRALLYSGIGTEILIILRALISSEVFFNWTSQSILVDQFISPSLFFAEYNFLTYIFEVGLMVSIAVAIFTCGALWVAKRMSYVDGLPSAEMPHPTHS